MKPVYQTIFGLPHGNCLQAAVASLFELELDDVPNFMERGDDWEKCFERFVLERGLQTVAFDVDGLRGIWAPVGYHLITGKSPRGDYLHEVVGYRGEPVHDPHPDGGCELKTMEFFTVFVLTFDVARKEGK